MLCSRSCEFMEAAVGSRNSGEEYRTRSAARNASFVRCMSSGPGCSSCTCWVAAQSEPGSKSTKGIGNSDARHLRLSLLDDLQAGLQDLRKGQKGWRQDQPTPERNLLEPMCSEHINMMSLLLLCRSQFEYPLSGASCGLCRAAHCLSSNNENRQQTSLQQH